MKTRYKKTFANIWDDLNLLPKHRIFTMEYCTNGFDKKKALSASGYKAGNTAASTILNNSNVQDAIKRYVDLVLGEGKIKLKKEIYDIWYKRAFYDPLMFYDVDGEPKITSLKDIPQEYRCVVDGVNKRYYGKDASRHVIELKLADREKALAWLDKYLGLTAEISKIEHSGTIENKSDMPVFNIKVIDTTTNNKVKADMEKMVQEQEADDKAKKGY